MKGGSLALRLSITCSVLPPAQSPGTPPALGAKFFNSEEPRWAEDEKQESYSTSFSCSGFVTSYNASLPWVALWVVAQAVMLTYFIQPGKIRVDDLKRISKETVNGKEEEVRRVSDYAVTIQPWCDFSSHIRTYSTLLYSSLKTPLSAEARGFLESCTFLGIPKRWQLNYSRVLIRQVCIIPKWEVSQHERLVLQHFKSRQGLVRPIPSKVWNQGLNSRDGIVLGIVWCHTVRCLRQDSQERNWVTDGLDELGCMRMAAVQANSLSIDPSEGD